MHFIHYIRYIFILFFLIKNIFQSALSDLLNSFKFSNLTFNEETDVQISRANNVSKNWDEIIPLEAREKLAEEERLQAEFQLAERRNRAKVFNYHAKFQFWYLVLIFNFDTL